MKKNSVCTFNKRTVVCSRCFINSSFCKGQTIKHKSFWGATLVCSGWSTCWRNGTLKMTLANQTLRWGGWCWHSPPGGWTCGSGSCSCSGWTAESRRSLHCWPTKGAAAASGPQQSTGSPSSCAISSWSPTAPLHWGNSRAQLQQSPGRIPVPAQRQVSPSCWHLQVRKRTQCSGCQKGGSTGG